MLNHEAMREEIKRQEEVTEQRRKEVTLRTIRRIAEVTIHERKMVCTVDEYLAECERRNKGEKPQLDDQGRKIQ